METKKEEKKVIKLGELETVIAVLLAVILLLVGAATITWIENNNIRKEYEEILVSAKNGYEDGYRHACDVVYSRFEHIGELNGASKEDEPESYLMIRTLIYAGEDEPEALELVYSYVE